MSPRRHRAARAGTGRLCGGDGREGLKAGAAAGEGRAGGGGGAEGSVAVRRRCARTPPRGWGRPLRRVRPAVEAASGSARRAPPPPSRHPGGCRGPTERGDTCADSLFRTVGWIPAFAGMTGFGGENGRCLPFGGADKTVGRHTLNTETLGRAITRRADGLWPHADHDDRGGWGRRWRWGRGAGGAPLLRPKRHPGERRGPTEGRDTRADSLFRTVGWIPAFAGMTGFGGGARWPDLRRRAGSRRRPRLRRRRGCVRCGRRAR